MMKHSTPRKIAMLFTMAVLLAGCGGGLGETGSSTPSGGTAATATTVSAEPIVAHEILRTAAALPATYKVTFMITSNWGSGFGADVVITNLGSQKITGWTLEFDFKPGIDQIWNGKVLSHEGTRYLIGAESWNGEIGPGKSVGFNGSPGGTFTNPTTFTLR
ncbi:MAG: hypothetical protein FJX76_27550, partial [Armatimonadetes bacterium]|nr:hypothetical protein [Armatimonadota bacterium]